jgi:chloramphenicol-sensitive protein RarD
MNRGITLALGAYIFWGLHPIYWKLLKHIPSVEIVSYRIICSFLFFGIILSLGRKWGELKRKITESNSKPILLMPALLIGSNWALYIWAVNAGYIIETSLGYFISPLISVFLGVIFLQEKLKRIQWTAVFIAGAGVLIMTFVYGHFPWISLYLAATWGAYGLLRKKSPLDSVEGLTLETSLLSLPVMIYLIYLAGTGTTSILSNFPTGILLIGTGLISGFPLILFITGARLIKLSLIGILQYIYPTLLFVIGAYIYDEQLSEGKIIGFIFIWIALIVYTADVTLFEKGKRLFAAAMNFLAKNNSFNREII